MKEQLRLSLVSGSGASALSLQLAWGSSSGQPVWSYLVGNLSVEPQNDPELLVETESGVIQTAGRHPTGWTTVLGLWVGGHSAVEPVGSPVAEG